MYMCLWRTPFNRKGSGKVRNVSFVQSSIIFFYRGKNSRVLEQKVVCVWMEEGIHAHLQKAGKKNAAFWEHILILPIAGAKFTLILMAKDNRAIETISN